MSSKPGDRTRVLILIKGLGLGGAENLIAESAPLWDTGSFEYRVAFLLPWKDQLVGKVTSHGIEVTCLDWEGPQSLGGISRLRRLVGDWNPHIVHSHLPLSGILGRLIATGRHQVYTEHNVVDYYRQPTRAINRATYGRNDRVIAVSDAVAESISSYPGPRPIVIPNGVVVTRPAEEDIESARSGLGIDRSTPLIVHVGNIRPHKGHNNLIDAMAILIRERPDVKAVSIGGEKHDGDLDRIRNRARELGLSDHLRFLGRRDDALTFFAAADVVVNPSDVEGLPVSLLEALALARPVVATAVGGVPTIVKDRETGVLVEPGNPAELAEGIELALDSSEAATWGESGSRLVAERHGLATMVAEYESIYRDLV